MERPFAALEWIGKTNNDMVKSQARSFSFLASMFIGVTAKSYWYVFRGDAMYVLKLKGDLVWHTSGPGESEDRLEFELEALLSRRPTPLLVYGEVHRRIKKTLNVNQLDALTFAKCLEEFAEEIRGAAETYE